jgi:hypothetical protein
MHDERVLSKEFLPSIFIQYHQISEMRIAPSCSKQIVNLGKNASIGEIDVSVGLPFGSEKKVITLELF